MTSRTWDIRIDGQRHTVLLKRNPWTSFRAVWVDGRLAASGLRLFDAGSGAFAIDGHPAELLISLAGFSGQFRYLLFVDNMTLVAQEDDPAGAWIAPMVEARNFWPDLARLTGLPYAADPQATGVGRHRLFGVLQGLPLFVRPIADQPGYWRSVAVTVRFAPAADLDHLKQQIRQDPELKALLGDPLGINSELTAWYYQTWLREGVQTPTAELTAQRVRDLVRLLRPYVSPPRRDACEWPTGPHDASQPPQWVLVNDVPRSLCQACRDDLPNRSGALLLDFAKPPTGRLKALLAGLGATLLAAMVASALVISVVQNVVFIPLFAGLIFGLNARLQDRILGQRRLTTMLFAVILAAVGGWLCLYLTSAWDVLRNAGRASDVLAALRLAPQTMWPTAPTETPRFETALIFFGLVCVLSIFGRWRERRRQLQEILRPRVEVLDGR